MATDMNALVEGLRDSISSIALMVKDRRDTSVLDSLRDEQQALREGVAELNATLVRVHDWRNVLLRGVLTGVATAFGATVIAAIAISVLVRAMHNVGIDMFLR